MLNLNFSDGTTFVSSAGRTTLAYDYENRITGLTYPNLSTNSFSYNGLDTRVSKTDSGGTTAFLRDGVGVTAPVITDTNASYTAGISERRSSTTNLPAQRPQEQRRPDRHRPNGGLVP